MATGALHKLSMVKETSYGVIPSGSGKPKMDVISHTGTTLAVNADTIESAMLTGSRFQGCTAAGSHSVGGDINFELYKHAGTTDKIIEAVLCGTWASNSVIPAKDRRSYTIERGFIDPDGTSVFQTYTGCEFATLNVSAQPNQYVTSGVGVIGQDMTASGAQTADSYNAAFAGCPMESFNGFVKDNADGALNENGYVTSIDFTLDNGMEQQFVVGKKQGLRPTLGQVSVTGNMSVMYMAKNANALLKKFLNNDNVHLQVKFSEGPSGASYTFDFPKIRITDASTDVSGPGIISLDMSFNAQFDSGENTNFTVTKSA